MAFLGDAANVVLGGVPDDVHQLFVVDVEPGDLVRASESMTDLGHTVHAVRTRLSESVGLLEGRWEGHGAIAFQGEVWEHLDNGLGVLELESHNAAIQLAQLASQAEQAHVQKVMALNHEIQQQLEVTAATWMLTPAAGKAISAVLGNAASRLGGELLSQIVTSVVEAIDQLIRKVLAAFITLFGRAAGSIGAPVADISGEIFGRMFGTAEATGFVYREAGSAGGSVPISSDRALRVASDAGGDYFDPEEVELRHVIEGDPEYFPDTTGHTSLTGSGAPVLNEAGKFLIYVQDEGLVSGREGG